MAKIVVTTHITATPEVVWRHLADVASHAEWMTDAESIVFKSEQHQGVGTEIEVATKVGPLRLTDVMEFTEWEAPRTMGVRHTGLVSGEGKFALEPTAAGTRMTWQEDLRFPAYLGGSVTAAAAKPILKRIWASNLRRLSERVESQG